MKLITKVEVKEVPNNPRVFIKEQIIPTEHKFFHEEIIHGRRFCKYHRDGEAEYDLVIGATTDVNDILGIYLGGWDDLQNKVDYYNMLWIDAHNDLEEVEEELRKFKNMKLWDKIKWIFKKSTTN